MIIVPLVTIGIILTALTVMIRNEHLRAQLRPIRVRITRTHRRGARS